MALNPENARHAAQILAGTTGRKTGHSFEAIVAEGINLIAMPFSRHALSAGCLFKGNPSRALLNFLLNELGIPRVKSVVAISAGALATAEEGARILVVNGVSVRRCKSDVILSLVAGGRTITKGVSVKQCSHKNPTNAQLYFSTAVAFCRLLRQNNIQVSDRAVEAMRMFCGDTGFRPLDNPAALRGRRCDPNRWFWEELPATARKELEDVFTKQQDAITRLLLQKAYLEDPFAPEFLVHQTRGVTKGKEIEVAIFSIDGFIRLSREYAGFHTRPYRIKKGSHKDPPDVEHLAPRFGVVQFQRGGQKQHPTQLQFNLKAGYFYKPPFSPLTEEAV
jgi:hypothetical protein